ncbi:MAG: hypothetical protein AB1635_18545 [Acidobacteriota bacterium]
MSKLVDLALDLFEWRQSESESRRGDVGAFLEKVHADCQALAAWSGTPDDESRLIQERLRAFYAVFSGLIGPDVPPTDREIVAHAIASARIYYWVRVLDGRSNEELDRLLLSRAGPRGAATTSLGVVERALAAVTGSPYSVSAEQALDDLRQACLRDFAALDALRERVRLQR